jgi:hypothetical protein
MYSELLKSSVYAQNYISQCAFLLYLCCQPHSLQLIPILLSLSEISLFIALTSYSFSSSKLALYVLLTLQFAKSLESYEWLITFLRL